MHRQWELWGEGEKKWRWQKKSCTAGRKTKRWGDLGEWDGRDRNKERQHSKREGCKQGWQEEGRGWEEMRALRTVGRRGRRGEDTRGWRKEKRTRAEVFRGICCCVLCRRESILNCTHTDTHKETRSTLNWMIWGCVTLMRVLIHPFLLPFFFFFCFSHLVPKKTLRARMKPSSFLITSFA